MFIVICVQCLENTTEFNNTTINKMIESYCQNITNTCKDSIDQYIDYKMEVFDRVVGGIFILMVLISLCICFYQYKLSEQLVCRVKTELHNKELLTIDFNKEKICQSTDIISVIQNKENVNSNKEQMIASDIQKEDVSFHPDNTNI